MRIVGRTLIALLAVFAFTQGRVQAQFKNGGQAIVLNLPRLSQKALVEQRIGISDVTILYHATLVSGREIWGKTIPNGQVWRAGANENTTITFTDDVTVEGKPLAAGTYGLHAIPNADQWTIIFSKNSTSWGSFSYDEKEDALRVNVKPQPAEFRESLAYTFDDVKPESAAATIRWEKLAVPFHIGVDVKALTLKSIHNQLRNTGGFTWAGYNEAANWCLDNNYNLDEALKWEETSIQNEDRFENWATKSHILEALGRKDDAAKALATALDKATAVQLYGYARSLHRQGNIKRALELYPLVSKRNPDHWIGHLALARIASNAGDFAAATKEIKLALAVAPDDGAKPALQGMLKKLEAKTDINK
jgi:tetratricopeptide (TPR) repeat protein